MKIYSVPSFYALVFTGFLLFIIFITIVKNLIFYLCKTNLKNNYYEIRTNLYRLLSTRCLLH
jgi:hypothetical protein